MEGLRQDSMDDDMQVPDIDAIIEIATEAEKQGIDPAMVLDPQELAAYQEFIENDVEEPTGHYDNLVSVVDSQFLARLGSDAVNFVLWDEKSRESWSKREKEGIRALGVSDKVSGGAAFEGASTVVHPLLSEAAIQFHSRALAEMFPPEGCVKTIVMGERTPERLQQAERVQDFMNYQYTEWMPGAFQEEDSLLFRLPLSGSCFKKLYYDPICRKIVSRLVEPADFIVPFSASDLETAPRYTHRYRESHNVLMKKVASGYYVKGKKIQKPTNEMYQYPEVKDEIDETEGKHRTGMDDNRHTILEVYIELDVPGFEDTDENGELTEIALPYIAWVNRDTQEVLRLQRNWKPNDHTKQPRVCFSHYKFMPGLGFYGYGLLHLIGGLADAATGALRALLDSAAFYNLQGGFRTRDSRIKGGDVALKPGEWKEVDSSAEELSKAFFQVPRHEPSNILFQLLGYLDDRGKSFIGTTDVMTGDANPNAPVGSTMALIEQGSKTFSAVHRRLHVGHRDEFRILARLNGEYLPEQGYPYYSKNSDRMVFAADFDDRVDVIPVSDPSIISNTQRIVQAQAGLDLAKQFPDRMDLDLALKTMLEALRLPNVPDWLKKDPAQAESAAKQQELVMAQMQADIDKTKAETEYLSVRSVGENVTSLYEANQTAVSILSTPAAIPTGDTLLLSAGFKDKNGAPMAAVDPNAVAQMQQQQAALNQPQNTSPAFPPNPPSPDMMPEQLPEAMPDIMSPEVGIGKGIETIENDGAVM